jgi:two-component system, NtrC family, sensor kinase
MMVEPVQTTLQQLHVPIISLDLDGRFTSLNPAAENLFARQASELIGQPFDTVLDQSSHEKADLMFQRVFENGQVDDWELDHARTGSVPFLVGYSASLLLDDDGQPFGIIAIGRDLSMQLDLTRQLAETNQNLEGALLKLEKTHAQLKATQVQLVQSEKMRSLGQMVAGVAHEINNPASYVANNLSHLERLLPAMQDLYKAQALLVPLADAPLQERIRQLENALGSEYLWDDLPNLVSESREGLERIRNIVLSLRSFSRLDTVEMLEADVQEGLRAAVRMVKALWKSSIDIQESYNNLPLVPCRPGELNQVFLNLLTNAAQAFEEAGTIWVTSRSYQNHVEISVRDNGIGMDAETLERLGEPFFTTRPVGSGTGLGLAVCFGIIDRHNGKLTFESQPGQGTTATIILPM